MAKNDERKEVFTVVEGRQGDKGWWVRIGTAWVNRDGSLGVTLDALPVNGRLVIREPYQADGRDERRAPEERAHGKTTSSWRGRPDR